MSAADCDQNVFINCPFDRSYKRIFNAVVFAVFDCGFVARSALEITNTSEIRVTKIARIIDECRFGYHDISRTGLGRTNQLPRFNMPFELGLFLGMSRTTDKNCLVVDRDQYRYQQFLSDIAGQDIAAHNNDPKTAITVVRNWLRSSQREGAVPGGAHIWKRYRSFKGKLPKICRDLHLIPGEMIFNDYATVVGEWLKENQEFLSGPSA